MVDAGGSAANSTVKPREHIFAIALGLEGGLGVVALLLGLLFRYSPAATLALDATDLAIGVAAAFPMLLVFAALFATDLAPLVRIREILDETIGTLFRELSVPALAAVSVAAGLGEELLFRGLVQGLAAELVGIVPALCVASILFGLAHPITRAYFVLATAFGFYLGWLWILTGNLLVPITTHATYDFLALVAILKRSRTRTLGGGVRESEPTTNARSADCKEHPPE